MAARPSTDLTDRIVVDPEILVGKPVVRGTRIPVELVLRKLSQNLDIDSLFQDYPRLTVEDVQACIRYAGALVEGEDVFPASNISRRSRRSTP